MRSLGHKAMVAVGGVAYSFLQTVVPAKANILESLFFPSQHTVIPFKAGRHSPLMVLVDEIPDGDEQREGFLLRDFIRQFYREQLEAGSLYTGPRGYDMSRTVYNAIPVGTCLTDAIAIVKYAGLEIEKLRPNGASEETFAEYSKDVFAYSLGYIPPPSLFTQIDVKIYIRPAATDRCEAVGSLKALMFVRSP